MNREKYMGYALRAESLPRGQTALPVKPVLSECQSTTIITNSMGTFQR